MKTTIASCLLLIANICLGQVTENNIFSKNRCMAVLDTNQLYYLSKDTFDYIGLIASYAKMAKQLESDSANYDDFATIFDTPKPIRLTPSIYQEAGEVIDGLFLVRRNDKYGFCDTLGKEVIPCTLDNASPFSDDVAIVFNDCKAAILTKTGEITLIKGDYNYINSFYEGTAVVQLKELEGLINKDGRQLVEPMYRALQRAGNKSFIFTDTLYNQGIIDSTGKVLYKSELFYIDNTGYETKSNLLNIGIDKEFKVKKEYKNYPQFAAIIDKYKLNKKYLSFAGIIDITGKTIIEPKYSFCNVESWSNSNTMFLSADIKDSLKFISGILSTAKSKIKFIKYNYYYPDNDYIKYDEDMNYTEDDFKKRMKRRISFFQKEYKNVQLLEDVYTSQGRFLGQLNKDSKILAGGKYFLYNANNNAKVYVSTTNDSVSFTNATAVDIFRVIASPLDTADIKTVLNNKDLLASLYGSVVDNQKYTDYVMLKNNTTNKQGLYTFKGQEIMPQEYDDFYSSYMNNKRVILASNTQYTDIYSLTFERLRRIPYDSIGINYANNILSYFSATESLDTTTQYYSVYKNKKEGIINYQYKEVIPPIYDQITATEESVFRVKLGEKYKIINLKAERLESPYFDEIYPDGNTRYIIKNDNKYTIIDTLFKQLLPKFYDKVDIYSFSNLNKEIALIDSIKRNNPTLNTDSLEEVRRYIFKNMKYFRDITLGYNSSFVYIVKDKDVISILDKNAKQLYSYSYIKPDASSMRNYDEDYYSRSFSLRTEYYVVNNKDGKYGVINLSNRQMHLPLVYDDIQIMYSPLAGRENPFNISLNNLSFVVKKDTNAYIQDIAGKNILGTTYRSLTFISDSMLLASSTFAYGVISLNGDTIVPFNYSYINTNAKGFDKDSLALTNEYVFVVWQGDMRGLYSTTAGEVIPCMYDDITPYSNDNSLYQLKKLPDDLRALFIKAVTAKKKRKKNKLFVEYGNLESKYYSEDKILYGIANKYGKVIIEPRYKLSQIDYYRNTIILTDNDGKRYFFNAAGQPVNDCYVEQDMHIEGTDDYYSPPPPPPPPPRDY